MPSFPSPLRLLLVPLLLLCITSSTQAVETYTVVGSTTNYSYNTTDNISVSVPTWSSGWGSGNTNTGWDYVGSVNGASADYLGNGWVLTAGHVGAGNFTLNGNTYDVITNSAYTGLTGYTNFTTTNIRGSYTADLNLYQISTTSTTGTTLTLPPLTLTANTPSVSSLVVSLGYGAGVYAWGTNAISAVNTPVSVSGYPYKSMDFSTTSNGTSYSVLVGGDSGGADFINVGGVWELAGINEASAPPIGDYVQLSDYNAEILAVMNAVPEPSTWGLLGLGSLAILLYRHRRSCIQLLPR